MEYYYRFMEKFPNVFALAAASEDEVLKVWQGLGYYQRARNLHHAAKAIVNERNGSLPSTYSEWKQLKGIGSYTAALIASVCFGESIPALDGNAMRFFARLMGWEEDIAKERTKKLFLERLSKEFPEEQPGDVNQAVMDLGSMICTPKQPKCGVCPVQSFCVAFKQDKVKELPFKSSSTKVVPIQLQYHIYLTDEKILLKKRDTSSFWKNMYDFPEENVPNLKPFKTVHFTHLLSHRKLSIHANFYELGETFQVDSPQLKWFKYQEVEQLALPKPIEKLFIEIANTLQE